MNTLLIFRSISNVFTIYIFETGKVESSRLILCLCSVVVVRVVVVRVVRCLIEVGASRVGVGPGGPHRCTTTPGGGGGTGFDYRVALDYI
jgi:hypothetical protein